MSKLNRLLLLLLVAQIGVIVAVRLLPQKKATKTSEKVLAFDAGKVAKLLVVDGTDKKKEGVVLARQGETWVVSSAGDYPVDGQKVDDLLGKLASLKAGPPVATKAAHHRALEVHAERFQRKVTLEFEGGKKLVFYLGSSPGLKKVHVRLDGKDAVVAAQPLSAWDVSGSVSGWIDTKYFSVDRERIATFVLQNAKGTLAIKRDAGKWVLEGEGEQPKLDQAQVDSLVSTFSSLYMRVPVGKKVEAKHGFGAPSATLTVSTRKAAETTGSAASQPSSQPSTLVKQRLRLGSKVDSAYYAKSDASSFVVEVDSSSAKELAEKSLDELKEKADGDKKAGVAPTGKPAMPPMGMPPGR